MRRPEQDIQKAVVQHLKLRAVPGVVWWHTPNGVAGRGRKYAIRGGIAKGMGVRAGVHDLCFLRPDGRFFTLELKAEGGRPTVEQMQFASEINAAGGFACIVEGVDRALRVLETWNLIRGVTA